jgi:hypothetical protein
MIVCLLYIQLQTVVLVTIYRCLHAYHCTAPVLQLSIVLLYVVLHELEASRGTR